MQQMANMRLILFIILGLYIQSTTAQDLSGEWVGNFKSTINITQTQKLVVHLRLQQDGIIKGTSHLFYNRDHFEHYVVEGYHNKETGIIYFEEISEIEVELGELSDNMMGNYTMQLIETDSTYRLEGKWRANKGSLFGLGNSRVWLEKRKPVTEKEPEPEEEKEEIIIEEIDTTAKELAILPETKQEQLSRITEVQQSVAISKQYANDITIEIYDNARVDNDVISLYMNDSLVIKKQPISKTPIVLHLSIPKDQPESFLKLVAESYGSMPPCTAEITIITPDKKRSFELLSNYDLNGTVQLMLQE